MGTPRKPAALDPEIVRLRALPIDKRAEMIVGMFRTVCDELVVMVLEHVEPAARSKIRRRLRRP